MTDTHEFTLTVNDSNFSQYRDTSGRVSSARAEMTPQQQLQTAGYSERIADKPLLDALDAKGISLKEVILHTSEFERIASLLFEGNLDLPKGSGVHEDGRPWRAESGPVLNAERMNSMGVDPEKVLMFRVTQPGGPKPEYYWTTDFMEARGGLALELGEAQRRTSIILVATLHSVAENGGLIRDMNDDQGVAVRQIGTALYDQESVIASLPGCY